MTTSQPQVGFRALTREIGETASPVRRYLECAVRGWDREVQRRYRRCAPPLVVPSAPPGEANPGIVGTAAGAARIGPAMMRALAGVPRLLEAALPGHVGGVATPDPSDVLVVPRIRDLLAPAGTGPREEQGGFLGPVAGSAVAPDLLARDCWALALCTETFRSGLAAAAGPLARLRGGTVTADSVLALALPAGLGQLAGLRQVFAAALIPKLAARTGPWALGPPSQARLRSGEPMATSSPLGCC